MLFCSRVAQAVAVAKAKVDYNLKYTHAPIDSKYVEVLWMLDNMWYVKLSAKS